MASGRDRKAWDERLRQLERLGLLLSFEDQLLGHQPSELEIEQCANEVDCLVIDLPDSQTLFVAWVSLWAKQPGVRLWDFRFEPPWQDHGFVRLPSFSDSHFGKCYCLPYGWEYQREDVLNLNFVKEGWRLPCIRVEGVLCALSDTPIPKEYKHGALIPVAVKFFGRAGQQLAEATVTLWADRLTHHQQRTEQTAQGRTAKTQSATNAAAKSATAQPPRPILYGPGGPELLPTPDRGQKKGSAPVAKVPAGGHGTGLFGA